MVSFTKHLYEESGVNVYLNVPVKSVFIVEGDQVPVTPLISVNGSKGALLNKHKVSIAATNGTTEGIMVTVKVSGSKQKYDESGVKM